jgi:hypothetical protein
MWRRVMLAVIVWIGLAALPVQARGIDGLLRGLNGIVTAPADLVSHVVSPPEDYDEIPAPELSGRVLGVFSGSILGAYRALTGALDVALTPLWVIPNLSPEPRYDLVPYYDLEEEPAGARE